VALQSRIDARAEDGIGIIEVLVSALIVVLVSMAVFAAIDAAGRTADQNKSRSVASSVAQSDQERLRSLPISQVGNLDSTRTVTVDGENYTVRSQGQYVTGPADATDCTSTEQNPKYLKITSTVSWRDIPTGIKPVTMDSLRTVPNGTLSGQGTLVVGVSDRSGAGLSGLTVNISGASNASATTNSNGCAVFGYIATGTYNVTASRAGYVDASNPTNSTLTGTVVVAADGVASKAFQYDQAGGVSVNYQTVPYGGGTATSTTGEGFTIANSGLGTLNTKTFTHATAATGSSGLVNFPFTSAYQVWSGGCSENQPPASMFDGTVATQTATVPKGATGTAVNVREPRLRVRVNRRNSTSTTATNNYAVMTADNKTTVKFTSTTTGCATTVTYNGTNGAVTNQGNTTAAGGVIGNYTTFEAVLPFGSYSVCAAYNGSTSNRASQTATGVLNNGPTGTTYGTTITVPYNQTTGYTC
jgi:Tfp pilus assembly protein PilV